jgi:gas vesicle protein
MRFIVGLVGGFVAGAAGAVWYSQQTGRDLREEFQQVRSELKARDFEGLGNHLEERFKELQASVEKLVAEAGDQAGKAKEAAEGAKTKAKDAVEDAADKAADAADEVADRADKVATPA